MEKLTVGQILASVPGEFLGDESAKGMTVSTFVQSVPRIQKDSVYFPDSKTALEGAGSFFVDNIAEITGRGAALVIIPRRLISTPPRTSL